MSVLGVCVEQSIALFRGDLTQRFQTAPGVCALSGAVFALHATIRKASDKTYLIAPSGVEVNETYDVDRRF